MKKPSPLVSIGIRNGVVAGVLIILLLMATYYFFDRHPLMVSPLMDFRVLLFGVFIFFTLKEFREDHHRGALYFWQGMMGSFVFILIAGTIASLLLLVFCFYESAFTADYVKAMTEYLKTFPQEDIDRIGKEVYQRNLEQLPSTNGKQLA
jgi:hypothetical protein